MDSIVNAADRPKQPKPASPAVVGVAVLFIGGVFLWLAWGFLTFVGRVVFGADPRPTETTLSETISKPDNTPVAVASGASIVRYSIASRKRVDGTEWIYVVPAYWPSNQELTDLALNLRETYPSASFEIVDSPLSVSGVEAFYTGDTSDFDDFAKKHEIAMINKFGEPPAAGLRWKLVTPTSEIIANLSKFMPTDPALMEAAKQRAVAAQLEVFRCQQLANKPLGELSANDLADIRACKAQGHW